jgi:hypothetical protein
MTRISTFCVVSSTLVMLALSANGALAEPPDPCKTGCKTGKGSHANPQLNPQPLPPGSQGGGGGAGKVTTGGAGTGNVKAGSGLSSGGNRPK